MKKGKPVMKYNFKFKQLVKEMVQADLVEPKRCVS